MIEVAMGADEAEKLKIALTWAFAHATGNDPDEARVNDLGACLIRHCERIEAAERVAFALLAGRPS